MKSNQILEINYEGRVYLFNKFSLFCCQNFFGISSLKSCLMFLGLYECGVNIFVGSIKAPIKISLCI